MRRLAAPAAFATPATRHTPRPRLNRLAQALMGACLLGGPVLAVLPAQAQTAAAMLPRGLQVVSGQAQMATQGALMTVRNTPGAILNWQSFSIGASAGVYFDQASAASKVLNRVTGNDPSQILGRLSSNGQVWLLNPHGVLFGQGARVDVASLVTSTLRLNDNDFLAGRYRFTAETGSTAWVRNEGTLQSSFGGQILLLGEQVHNSGSISAPGGSVGLAAARSVDLVDTGLPNLAVRVQVPAGEVLNLGRLVADGGKVDVHGAIVNQSGLVQANTLGLSATGEVVLRASETLTLAQGSSTQAAADELGAAAGRVTLDAGALTHIDGQVLATSGQGQGGALVAQGTRILLGQHARLDASGATGGGSVRVGGGFQGKDAAVRHAEMVAVASGAQLAADATQAGDGGLVVVWSDAATRFAGTANARGGAQGGDGGLVEVSSKGYLDFRGQSDRSAPRGRDGTLLLDPTNLSIEASGPDINDDGTPGDDLTSLLLAFAAPGGNSVITAGAVDVQLANGGVMLQATNNLSVNAAISGAFNPLTLQAGNDILVSAPINLGSGALVLSANDADGLPSGFGAVFLTAPITAGSVFATNGGGSGSHSFASNITTNTLDVNGNITLAAPNIWTLQSGTSPISNIISGTGSLTLAGAGTLELGAPNSYSGGTTVNAGTLRLNNSGASAGTGSITLNPGATLDLTGNAVVNNTVLITGATVSNSAGAGSVNGPVVLVSDASFTSEGFGLAVAGGISGAAGIVTGGSSIVTLGGVNSYTGNTSVSSGLLVTAATNTLPDTTLVSVAGGATLSLGGSDTVAALALSGTLGGEGSLTAASYALAGGTVTSVVLGAGALSSTGGSTIFTSTAAATVDVNGGTLTMVGANGLSDTAAVTVAPGATLVLGGSDTVSALTLAGTLGGAGVLTAASYSLQDGAVINADLGAGTLGISGNVVLNGTAQADSVAVTTGGTLVLGASERLADTAAVFVAAGGTLSLGGFETISTLDLAGTLAGGGTLAPISTVLSNGAVVGAALLGDNVTSTGDVTVNAAISPITLTVNSGNFVVNLADALGSGATLVVNGGFFDMGSNASAVEGVVLAGGTIRGEFNAFSDYDLRNGEFVGVMGGDVGAVKTTTGTVVISGDNIYAGNTTISNGTLALGNGGTFGTLPPTPVINNGVLRFSRSDNVVFPNNISGTGTVEQNNPGSTTLTGSNTYSGNTLVAAGKLVGGNSGSLSNISDFAVSSGATLELSADGGVNSLFLAGTLQGSGTLGVAGNAALVDANLNSPLVANTLTSEGGSVLRAAVFSDGSASVNNGVLTVGDGSVSGALVLASPVFVAGGAVLAYNRADTVTLDSTSGPGTLRQAGTGELQITGNVNASTVEVFAGTLSLAAGSTNRLSDTSTVSVASGATLRLDNGAETVGTLTLAGSLDAAGATLTAFSYTLDGGAVHANLGTGTLVSNGSSSLLGTADVTSVDVVGGTLTLGSALRLLALPAVNVQAGADLALGGNEVLGPLTGAGAVHLGTAQLIVTVGGPSVFDGSIDGSGGLIKQGAGTLTLTGSQFYSGGTTVDAGTLATDAANLLPDASAVAVNSGATLSLGGDDIVGSLALLGTLSGSGTLTASSYTTATGAVVNANLGPGLLVVAGDTLLGGTAAASVVNLSSGVLTLGAAGRLVGLPALDASSDTSLVLAGNETLGSLSGQGSINLGAATLSTGAGGSSTFGGSITGTGGLTKQGPGSFTLNGSSTYGGATLVEAGTLVGAATGSLSSLSDFAVSGGATLELLADAGINNLSLAGTLQGSGTLAVAGTAALVSGHVNSPLLAPTFTSDGTSVLRADVSLGTAASVNTGVLTVGDGAASGALVLSSPVFVASGAVLAYNRADNVTLDSTSGTGTLRQVGTGTLLITGNVNASTVEVNAGTLSLAAGSGDRLNNSSTVSVASGATLRLDNGAETVGALTLAGALDAAGATLTAASYTLDSGAVHANLGAGALVSSGNSSLLGTAAVTSVNVVAGTLTLGSALRLLTVPDVNVDAGATLALGGDEVLGTLTGAGGVLLGTGLLAVGVGGSSVFDGSISGIGGLAKQGAGTLTLSGTHFYGGATLVEAGTLATADANRLSDLSAVVVNSGATLSLGGDDTVANLALQGTLSGTGTLSAAAYTMGTGAVVNANLGTGTLQIVGDTALNGTAAASVVDVNSGVLTLGSAGRWTGAPVVTVSNAAAMQMSGDETIASLILTGSLTGTGTLTAATYATGFGAAINANLGAGTLQIGGDTALNGTAAVSVVDVNSGVLTLGSAGRWAGLPAVSISSGGFMDMSGNETIASLSGAGTVTLSAGTLTTGAGADSTFAGSLVGAGGLTKTGASTFTWFGSGGYTGLTTIEAGTLEVTVDTIFTNLTMSGGALAGAGNVTVVGAFDVTGTTAALLGTGSFTTQAGSTINLAQANASLDVAKPWLNNGTLAVAGDDYLQLDASNGGSLTNALGGVIDLSTSFGFAVRTLAGAPTVTNNGTINRNTSGLVTLQAGNFDNAGTVAVNAGTLVINAAGTDSGAYNIAAGAGVGFATGARVLASGASVAGNGKFEVSSGTVDINTALSPGGVTFQTSSGTLNFNAVSPITVANLTHTGGTIGGTGDVVVTGQFNAIGTSGTLTGSGTLTTQGTGSVDLPAVAGGTLTVDKAWVNTGSLVLGGDDRLSIVSATGSLTNTATGGIDLVGSDATPISGTGTFSNAGTLFKLSASTQSVSAGLFVNTGTVDVQAGTLGIVNALSQSGTLKTAAGTVLELPDGFVNLAGGTLAGDGTILVGAGTIIDTLTNEGTIAPGAVGTAGTLSIFGTLVQTTGNLSLDLGGTGAGASDVLAVSGAVSLAGTITAGLIGGYTPSEGDFIPVLTTPFAVSGTFGTSTLPQDFTAGYNLAANEGVRLIYAHVPGTLVFTNGGGDLNWNTPANWSTGALPLPVDSALISSGFAVAHPSGTNAVTGLTISGSNSLNVSGGTLAVSGTTDLGGTLTVSGGAVTLGGGLGGAGALNVSGGSLTLNAVSSIGSLNFTSGLLTGSGDLTVAGALNFTGGTVTLGGTGTLRSLGTTTLDTSALPGDAVFVNRPWINSGTLNISGDDFLSIDSTAVFTNDAGGVINLSGNDTAPIRSQSAGSTFSNAGTINHALTGDRSISATNISNTGTLDVSAGTLTLNGAFTQSGTIHTSAGATFQTGAAFTNGPGGTLQGTGTINVGGGSGTLTNQGTLVPGSAGTPGTLTVTGNLDLASGTVLLDLGGTSAGQSDKLAVSGNVALGGSVTAGLLGGYTPADGDFIPVLAHGGTAVGTFALPTLPGGFTLGYNLAAGEAARAIFSSSGARIFTNAAGDLNWATPANWGGSLPGAGDTALISAGFAVQHASGIDTIASLTLSAANAVDVSDGSLSITGNMLLGGSFTVSGRGTATVGGTVSGGGSVVVSGGSLTLNGAASLAGLNLSGGLLDGTGSLAVNGSISRSAGASIGSGFSSISLTQTTGDLRPGALSAGSVLLATQDAASTLILDAPVLAGGTVQVAGTGGVRLLSGAALTAGAAGEAIVIDAGTGPFDNQAGAGALQASNGRWLVYSANPASDTVGGLPATFRQLNAPFGTTPLGAGSGLLYSHAATLTASLQGPIDKVYDRSTAATVAPGNYLVGGALATDVVVLNSPAVGSYTTGGTAATPQGAGTGKTVLVTGVTASVTDSGTGIPVYGYQFDGTASGAVGSISALALLPSGAVVANKVYDATSVATVVSAGNVTPLAGDVVGLVASGASFSDKNVGTAKPVALSGLALTGADAANYVLQAPGPVTADITALVLPLTGLAASNKVYDANTVAALAGTAAVTPLAGDTVTLLGTAAGAFADKNVGMAKPVALSGLSLGGADAGNYLLQLPSTLVADISVLNLALSGLSAGNKVYDANTVAPLAGTAAINPLGGDSVTLLGTAAGAFADKNVGSAKPVAVTGLLLSGADAGNYALQLPSTLVADISVLNLALTGLSAGNKVYDATTFATLSGTAAINPLAGDSVTLLGTAAGAFADKNVGTAKSVALSGVTLGGADAGNYALQLPSTLAADISALALPVAGLSASSKVYDATSAATLAGTAAVVPLAGDVVALSGTASASFADKNVGTAKAVSVAGLALSGTDAGNYTLQLPSTLAADITALVLPLNGLAANSKIYDATTLATLAGTAAINPLAGDSVTLLGTAAGAFADKNVGSAKPVAVSGLSLGGADAGNYLLQPPSTLVADISVLNLALTGLSAGNKVYDATTFAALSGTAAINPLAGDSVTLLGTAAGAFADKNVGTAKSVALSGVTLGGADAGNYALQLPSTLAADISALALPVAGLSASSKVYDATTAATLAGTAAVVPLAGDVVALSGSASASFADKNVGTAKVVSVAGLALSGTDAGNYTLQLPSTLAADITARDLLVNGLAASGKVYDASVVAALSGTAAIAPLGGDSVTLLGSAAGAFADKNVGSAKPVSVSGLSLGGADAGNYTLRTPSTLQATITAAPLPVTGLTALDKTYDTGTAAALAGTAAVAALGSDVVLLGGTPSAQFADRHVGVAKAVSVSGYSLSGADAGNYTLLPPTGLSARINAATLALVGLQATDKVYDGSTNASASATLGGVLGADQVSLGLQALFADAGAGVSKAVNVTAQITGADATNYTLPGNLFASSASIAPATLRYLAEPAVAVSGGVLPVLTGAVAGFVAGESLGTATTGTLQWTTPASSSSPAGRYAVLGSGLAAANYRFEQGPANDTALTLTAATTNDPASNAVSTSIGSALTAVSIVMETSTPSSGRVLDVVQALTTTTTTTEPPAEPAGEGSTPAATAAAAATTTTAPAPTGYGYRAMNFSLMSREEIQGLLAARAGHKQKVLSTTINKLEQDPSLADVRGCANEAELATGNCLITDTLKQEIQAKVARATVKPAPRSKRKLKQVTLPNIERKLALLIGINNYADKRIPQLAGAVPDTQAVRALLESRMGYEATLVPDASREGIIRAFNKLALEADGNDSVIIYYAGHGVVLPAEPGAKGGGNGFWLPADSDAETPQSWISNADISRLVSLVGSRQLMLVSDSCYSGNLAGSERVQVDGKAEAADLLSRRAAVVMSSGGDEPVADEGRNGHSVFAWHLMQSLGDVTQWQTGSTVFARVQAAVRKDFPQTPQYGAARSAGHQGNTDYLFERREFDGNVTP